MSGIEQLLSTRNEPKTLLGDHAKKTREDFAELRARVLDVEQKLHTRAPGTGGGEPANSSNGLAEIITKTAGYDSFRTGQLRDLKIPIPSGLKNWIVNATGASQPLVQGDRERQITGIAHRALRIRDLIPVLQTGSNSVEYPVHATYTNNARPQGDASPGGIEGELFAESAFTFTLATAPVVTIGHVAVASQQILEDSQVLGGFLSDEGVYGLKLEEEEEILTGDGSAGTLNGLVNQATAYNGGATNDTILDTLAKGKKQLELANFNPDAVVLSPADFLTMATLKDTTGQYVWGDPKSDAPPTVWNVPIVVSNSMTQGRFLMADFKQAATIWDRTQAMVELSTSHSDFFQRHLVMLKFWERIALTVRRATALVYGNTGHAG